MSASPFTWMKYGPLHAAIVVSLDLRSSSWIVDDLESSGNLDRLGGFWGQLKRCLGNELQKNRGLRFTPYKFIGDSWILLFLVDNPGQAILAGLREFCSVYDKELATLSPHLTVPPDKTGIAFGIDAGPLLPTTIFGQQEYLARTINVATRLQSLAKQLPERFPTLISGAAYDAHFTDAGCDVTRTSRALRGLRNGGRFPCVRVRWRGDAPS